jgi:Peptide N-acetyl-beta-D-glucosaminyl asparaginase amidase A
VLLLATLLAASPLLSAAPAAGAPSAPRAAAAGPAAPPAMPFSWPSSTTAATAPAGGALPASGASIPGAASLVRPEVGPQVSAVPVEPDPALPPETPVTVTLVTGLVNCCLEANFTLPAGSWERIVLNYTGEVIGNVYDSSYRLYVDRVPVLFGTTPEYGIWGVTKDLTEYAAILRGVTNITFLLGAATLGGHFVSNLSLAFYPEPPGAPPPTEANVVLPLWYSTALTPTQPVAYQDVVVPSNASAARLELWEYGFNPDEFWYSQDPAYRALTVAIDGSPIVTEYPFPFVNTGGIDLFLWRPVTAVATVNDPPREFDLTGALGMLEGARNFTINFSGISSGSRWIVDGALFLTTNSSTPAATVAAYSASVRELPPWTANRVRHESGFANYSVTSLVIGNGAIRTVSSSSFGRFSANVSTSADGSWENLSMESRTVEHTQVGDGSSTAFTNDSFDAPFAVDLGTQAVGPSSGNTVNVTVSFLHATQIWNDTSVSVTPALGLSAASTVADGLLDANGNFTGQELITGPNAGQITSVRWIQTDAPRSYRSSESSGPLSASYQHTVESRGTNPPLSVNNAAPVIANSATSSIAVGGSLSPARIDAGSSALFVASTLGGVGALAYAWQGLPSVCPSGGRDAVVCSPTTPGAYVVNVTVHDATGASARYRFATLQVVAAPQVSIVAPGSVAWDEGSSVELNASVQGGLGPFRCQWYVDGAASGPAAGCSAPYTFAADATGAFSLTVDVVDAQNVANLSVPLVLTVVNALTVVLLNDSLPSTSVTAVVGSHVAIAAEPIDGVAPFVVSWFLNNRALASEHGWWLNVTAAGPVGQTETVYAVVNDSGGGSAQSTPLTITSEAGRTTSPPGSGNGSAPSVDPALIAVFSVAIVAAIALVALLLRRRASRP